VNWTQAAKEDFWKKMQPLEQIIPEGHWRPRTQVLAAVRDAVASTMPLR